MIYFIQSPHDKRIKIGMSENPNLRIRDLQTGSSSKESHVPLLVLPGGRKRESELHSVFKKFRSHGEWFNPVPEILDYIKQETQEEFKYCRVCGKLYLSTPDKIDIQAHSKAHKIIRIGGYPYSIREFMKEMAWAFLANETPTVEISTQLSWEKF